MPSGTARRTKDFYVDRGGSAEAIVYPGMGHSIGEWGRKEIADMMTRIISLVENVVTRQR